MTGAAMFRNMWGCLTFFGLTVLTVTEADGQAPTYQPVTWLTHDTLAIDMWAYVAPNGHTITFSRSMDGGKTWRLKKIDRIAGGIASFLRNPPAISVTRASWSRPHNRVAFTAGTRGDDTTAIWWANASGTQVARIPTSDLSTKVFYPSWTPDGRSVVVVDYGAPSGSTLYKVDLKSGASTALTRPAEFLVGMPTVSPGGQMIAFAGQRNAGATYDQRKNQIWILSRSGPPREISAGQGRQPDWSPDGRWVAFASSRGDSMGRHAVFVVARDGGVAIQLTDHRVNAQHPVWSPDGRWIVFCGEFAENKPSRGVAVVPVPMHR
jgi:Tol biopolymer transport system component